MARTRVLSKEAREYIVSELREKGEMTKSEIVEFIRPHCSFDPLALQEQALNREANYIIRSIRDEQGVRTVFILRSEDAVVDVESCRTYSKVAAVEQQLAKKLDGITASHRKAQRRMAELTGQLSLFDDAPKTAAG